MGFWDDLEDKLDKADKEFKEAKEKEAEWLRELDRLISDPHALDNLSSDEMEHYRITAESEIERTENHIKGTDKLGEMVQGPGAGLFGLAKVLSSNAGGNYIQKNKRLLAKIKSKQKALSTPAASPDPAAEKIARLKDIKRRWDESKKNNPQELWPDIDRVYAKLMDDERNKP